MVIHWTARVLSLAIAGVFFLFLFGEGLGTAGRPSLIRVTAILSPAYICLSLLVLGVLALLLAWRWERLSGAAAAVFGVVFLVCCLVMPGMRPAWFLGPAIAIPGLLYVVAAGTR
jgi:membrane-bound ClpP family serine protease